MQQIESISKRLDKKLTCEVDYNAEEDLANYWRVIKRVPAAEWTEMTPAQITLKVIDPLLEGIAATFNEWGSVSVRKLPVLEDKVVACLLSADGRVPLRLFLSPAGDDVIILIDLLARPTESKESA